VVLYGAALRVPLDWDGEQGRGARCHSGPNVGTVTAQGFGHERENVGGVRAIDALVCEATVAPSQGENLLVTGDLDDRRRTNYLERTAVRGVQRNVREGILSRAGVPSPFEYVASMFTTLTRRPDDSKHSDGKRLAWRKNAVYDIDALSAWSALTMKLRSSLSVFENAPGR
jgi:hypothetical protein